MAKKYGTKKNHFSHKKVGFIRGSFFGFDKDRDQTVKWVKEKLELPKRRRHHSLKWYQYLLNFLKNECSNDVWEDLTQEITMTNYKSKEEDKEEHKEEHELSIGGLF